MMYEDVLCPLCDNEVCQICGECQTLSCSVFRCEHAADVDAESEKEIFCNCGNPEYGFNCMCDWMKQHPGSFEYSCEFCGLYVASKPRCNKCETDDDDNYTSLPSMWSK